MVPTQLPRPNVWIDVGDLIAFCAAHGPGDVQLLAFDVVCAMRAAEPARVRLVRRGPKNGPLLVEAAWDDLAGVMHRAPVSATSSAVEAGAANRVGVLNAIESLPEHLRGPLFRAGLLQTHALRSWSELARALRAPRRRPAAAPMIAAAATTAPDVPIGPGDPYLVLGAPWAVPGCATPVAAVKERYGVRAHLLLHDLAAVRHREWCTKAEVAALRDWLHAELAQFDGLMAVSRYTEEDVLAYARENGLPLGAEVRTIPIGTGFGPGRAIDGPAPAGLPAAGSYVLIVSPVEIRRNHELAFRVWRQLYDDVRAGARPAGALPTLVFAGRVGRLSSDLLQQLDNTRWLDGRIRLIADPTDRELRALYAGCLFTLMPSWFEGWGTPVGESLAAGKPCFAARATALPEAGGTLCRYFDPGNPGQLREAIVAVMDAPGEIAAWQDRVRRTFRPVPWSATAEAVLGCLTPVPA